MEIAQGEEKTREQGEKRFFLGSTNSRERKRIAQLVV